jgi:predicted small metal-binding protein
MAQREYKELSCRDAGADCDFMVRSEKEEEVLRLAGEHACGSHNMCEITPELKGKIQGSIKSVWCEGTCHSRPRVEVSPPWGYLS